MAMGKAMTIAFDRGGWPTEVVLLLGSGSEINIKSISNHVEIMLIWA